MSLREAIIAEVMTRTGIWDAYDQGRLAYAEGTPQEANPWRHPTLGYHVNIGDWDRGWRAASATVARPGAA